MASLISLILTILVGGMAVQFTLEPIFALDPRETIFRPPVKKLVALLASLAVVMLLNLQIFSMLPSGRTRQVTLPSDGAVKSDSSQTFAADVTAKVDTLATRSDGNERRSGSPLPAVADTIISALIISRASKLVEDLLKKLEK